MLDRTCPAARLAFQRSSADSAPDLEEGLVPSNCKLLPYQTAGVRVIAESGRKLNLLADEPGLGKTAQALVVANIVRPNTLLIICPASLLGVWRDEGQKWLTRLPAPQPTGSKGIPVTPCVVISYDRAVLYYDELKKRHWDMVICDEAHYMRTPTAKRTRVGVNLLHRATKKALALTGTPVVNRPIELYCLLHNLAPDVIDNMAMHDYGVRYCRPTALPDGTVEYRGSDNEAELGWRLRSTKFMVRRTKSEVLSQLPEKTIRVIPFRLPVELPDEGNLAANRRTLGVAKVPFAASYVADMLDGGVEKVVVFAHHLAALDLLESALEKFKPVRIDGSTSDRNGRVRTFQSDPARRVFLGQIIACNTGITLTAAADVVMVECSWSPGDNDQAEDRCHRVTQTKAVTIHYLLAEGTVDDVVSRVIERKRNNITGVMSTEIVNEGVIE